jgi:hypothetical protein
MVTEVDVFSLGPHTRRSRDLYRLALGPGVMVGSVAAPPSEYDIGHWWQRSAGARDVVGEALSYAWTMVWFRPRSHEESWSVPPSQQGKR